MPKTHKIGFLSLGCPQGSENILWKDRRLNQPPFDFTDNHGCQ